MNPRQVVSSTSGEFVFRDGERRRIFGLEFLLRDPKAAPEADAEKEKPTAALFFKRAAWGRASSARPD
ncbi:MAG: hypothetical protein OEW18_11365 [Candidatus Aminicenantes bacterium]|nr:hypothetical protein [Candidatus Aminicenantes bacterium]